MKPLCFALLVPLAAALSVTTAGPAFAEPTRPTFGSHVSACAQSSGFSGHHNPSHHHGPSGWDGAMTC